MDTMMISAISKLLSMTERNNLDSKDLEITILILIVLGPLLKGNTIIVR